METIRTNGQIFDDGQAIEVVRRQAGDDTNKLALLYFDGRQSRITDQLELNGKNYEPTEVTADLLRAVRFPTEPRDFDSPAALVKNLGAIIEEYSGLSDRLSRLTALYVVGTWLYDLVGTAPRLIVHGSPGRAVDQLQKILNCVCRHTIALADVTPGSLLSVPFPLGVTLLIRQRKMTERLRRFLLASGSGDQFIRHGGGFINPFCPVVLQVEEVSDSGVSVIELPMRVTRQEIPFLDSAAAAAIAEELQGQLLAYRLANLHEARGSNFDPTELTSAVRETARSIGACFPSDPTLQAELVSLLRSADAHARVLSSTSQEAITAEALLYLCHQKNGSGCDEIYVGEIAEAVRVLNQGRGEMSNPSPRALGEVLRALGFATEKLDKHGRGVLLGREIYRKIHEVACDFDAPSLAAGMHGCDECTLVRGVQTQRLSLRR